MKPNIFEFLCSVFINYNLEYMRISALFLGVLLFANVGVYARSTTFILVRHAEKDSSPTASKTNPELTAQGKQRAMRLYDLIKDCRPQYIFSTPFIRTFDTAAPTADSVIPNYRLQIQFYDFDELEEFTAKVLNLDARCVLIVGHNSTTPALANLIIKKEKYKPLADNEYNKAFFVTVNGEKIEDKVIEY